MNKEPLKIKKRGEDGTHIVSVRMWDHIYNKLEELAKATGRSRNELINLILEHGIDNIQIEE